MRYFTIKNWREFQHYTKRNPPWIKLHRTLIDDYHFAALPDESKAHLMMIWLLASSSEGRLPHDPKFLAARIGATSKVNLDALAHFIIIEDDSGSPEPTDSTRINGSHHAAIADTGDIVEHIPMIGGEEFAVRQSFADELSRLYPAVDVPATLKQMRGWCLGNPQRLKTPRGIRKFIVAWCDREQNRG